MLGKTVIVLLRLYQCTISPFLGPKCRYFPTCSSYAIEAVHVHGSIYGSYLGAKRLLKCHPFCKGGVDLVPTTDTPKLFSKKSPLKHEET